MRFFDGIEFPLIGMVNDDFYRRVNRPLYFGIQYNHSGRLRLRINGERWFELDGAWVFVTWPGALFEYELCPGNPHEYRYLCFQGESVRRYIDGGLLTLSTAPIRITNPVRFAMLFDKLIAMKKDFSEYVPSRLIWEFQGLLLELSEQNRFVENSPGIYGTALERLVNRIRSEPEQEWDFQKISSDFQVTLIHFRRIFGNYFGISPQQFVIRCRLDKAAGLLCSESLRIKEVAARSGFSDEYYFSRLFKQKYKLSPTLYRKEFYSITVSGPSGACH